MLVIINALLREILLISELLEHFQNLRLSGDMIFPNNKSFILANWVMKLEPPVFSYIGRRVTSIRISVKDPSQDVGGITRNKLRQREITLQNFLIELGGVWVFKRQVTANHGIKNNTTTPDIYLGRNVVVACYHFRCSITRRSTCSF